MNNSLSVCHWNFNGTTAYNFMNICLFEAYNAVQTFEIICLSQSVLDSDYSLWSCDMIRCDFPGKIIRVGLFMNFKKNLPLPRRHQIFHLSQCILCEITIKRSKCLPCLYRCKELRKRAQNILPKFRKHLL